REPERTESARAPRPLAEVAFESARSIPGSGVAGPMLVNLRAGSASRPRCGGMLRIHANAAGAQSDRAQPLGRRVEPNRAMENLCRSWLFLKSPAWRMRRGRPKTFAR